ncbi:MAG TPA: hypothetical protein VNW99_01705 [Cytophagaceae bacterium]|nr:hypothetical protein [Cytophagaceae bacterium]
MIKQKNSDRCSFARQTFADAKFNFNFSTPGLIMLLTLYSGFTQRCRAQALKDSVSLQKGHCKNLITNGNFESGNTGFSSEYQYVTDYIDHGKYTITTNVNALNKNFISPAHGDHTSGEGKYMVVDSKIYRYSDRSKIWCSEVSHVKKNTDYSFSVWMSRTSIGSPPELQIIIDDKPIANSYRLKSSPGDWEEIRYTWTSKRKREKISVCIVSIYYYQYMEDFVMDDISFCAQPNH